MDDLLNRESALRSYRTKGGNTVELREFHSGEVDANVHCQLYGNQQFHILEASTTQLEQCVCITCGQRLTAGCTEQALDENHRAVLADFHAWLTSRSCCDEADDFRILFFDINQYLADHRG